MDSMQQPESESQSFDGKEENLLDVDLIPMTGEEGGNGGDQSGREPSSYIPGSFDPTDIQADLTTIHGDLTPIHDDLTPIQADLTPIHGYLIPIHDDLTPIHGDLTPIHGDLTPIHDDLIPIHGDLIPIHGNLIPIHGDYDQPRRTPVQMRPNPNRLFKGRPPEMDFDVVVKHRLTNDGQVIFEPQIRPGRGARPQQTDSQMNSNKVTVLRIVTQSPPVGQSSRTDDTRF